MTGRIIVKSEFKMNFSGKMSVTIVTVPVHSTDLKIPPTNYKKLSFEKIFL